MTTIAVRDGVMAADRRVTCGDAIAGEVGKLMMLPDGRVVGVCGQPMGMAAVFEWIANGAKFDEVPPESKDGDIMALVLHPDGAVEHFENGRPMRIAAAFHAEGSGRAFALGAMAMGATAVQAVETAIRFDSKSGGGVDALWVDAP